jgi:uncharacterized protein (TIGR00266 family)
MQTKITGTILPVLQVGLDPRETVIASPGQLSWMTASIGLHTTMNTGGNTGLWGAVKRAVGGGGLFMTEYSASGSPGVVAFAAKVPGGIQAVEVRPGQSFMIHRHGFLCATPGVELGIGFQRSLGAGVFGGDGFLLQRLSGACTAWVELGGEIVSHDLAPGETLRVHPGHVGMFEERVGFDIVMMQGVRNALFGGDGFFLAQLTGPGRVWLQTLTLPNLAHALEPYMVRQEGRTAAEVGIAGTVLRDIFGGN